MHKGRSFHHMMRNHCGNGFGRLGFLACVATLGKYRLTIPFLRRLQDTLDRIALKNSQLLANSSQFTVQIRQALKHEPAAVVTHSLLSLAPFRAAGNDKNKHRLIRFLSHGRECWIIQQTQIFSKPIKGAHHSSSIRFKFIAAVSRSARCFSGSMRSHVLYAIPIRGLRSNLSRWRS